MNFEVKKLHLSMASFFIFENIILFACVLEARSGFAVVENSLWKAVPIFFRDLDELLLNVGGKRLPLHASPIRFASWMGGDRDV